MQLQNILNRVYRFKSFCYQDARFNDRGEIEVPFSSGQPHLVRRGTQS